jgi:cytochrome P450
MTAIADASAIAALPLAPPNPLPYRQRLADVRDATEGVRRLCAAGGPVMRVTLGPKWLVPTLVYVSSPQGARDVLARRDGGTDRAALPSMKELRYVVGANLLNLDHEHWVPRRRAMQPIFSKQNITQFGAHIVDATEDLSRRWRAGTEVDLAADTRAMTMSALSRSFLGRDLAAESQAVGAAMHAAFLWAMHRSMAPARVPAWLPTPAQRRAHRGSAALHRYAAEVLKTCRTNPDHDAPIVHALIAARDPDTGEALSDNDICDELTMFLFGGHDTLTMLLVSALWMLGRHPEAQHRVADEARGVGGRALTAADVPSLGYTVQVLHEALRLYPPGPAVPRLVCKDIEVDGYRVQAGTVAIVAAYAMHRDPAIWRDPLRFDPDRFRPELAERIDRWQYLPFGGGPHRCMGDHFAMLEATLALATVVRDIEFTALSAELPIITTMTMQPSGPVPMRVRRRPS